MNSISCLCLTAGRVPRLEEAIDSFRRQECSWPTELVIVNTLPAQKLELEGMDGIRIVNLLTRPDCLGDARNMAASVAYGTHFVTWDDDDVYLPHYLQKFVDVFEANPEAQWAWQNKQIYMEGGRPKKISQGTFNTVAFTKEAWKSVGAYSSINVGEDRDFVGKVTKLPGVHAEIHPRDIGFLYCWGNNVYHISGMGNDQKGKTNAWDRARQDLERKIKSGTIPTGKIKLNPHWKHDYQKIVDDFLVAEGYAGPKINGTGVVLLGKYGDIINALPILERLHAQGKNPNLVVSKEFAPILDGVSYVTPFPVDLHHEQAGDALKLAKERFSETLLLQVYGKGIELHRHAESWNKEIWERGGYSGLFHDERRPPKFDRRNLIREAAIAKKLFVTKKPKIVTNVLRGSSSPFARGAGVLMAIRNEYSKSHEIVDIGHLKLERIYDLLGIIEKAALFVSIDTATLHLAAATSVPVLALVNDKPWAASIVRFNEAATIPYAEATGKHVVEVMKSIVAGGGRKRLPRCGGKDTIIVRRTNSLGDVLAATPVADALMAMGYNVQFQCHENCHPMMAYHPRIKNVQVPMGTPHVNLDGAYENHPDRSTKHIHDIYHEVAAKQLLAYGIVLPKPCNWAPELVCKPDGQDSLKRPWVAIIPRSNCWENRTVPDEVWQEAAKHINGQCWWVGNHSPAPDGMDGGCRTVDDVVRTIAICDFVVSVDTGPMHIAAALKKPMLVIKQAVDPALRLSQQRDWSVYEPDLDCLNCNLPKCPKADVPPCQNIDGERLAAYINALNLMREVDSVSAVIAVYKPDVKKLNRCIEAVKPQVEEVIVCGDLDTPWPIEGALQSPNIRYVRRMEHATGYGKKATYGARMSVGSFIHLLNDDVYLDPGVIYKLKDEMKPDVAIVTHTLRYMDGTIQYAGSFRPRAAMGFGHIDLKKAESRYTAPIEQETACGASMLIRREAFFQVGAFDERYYLYSEDTDLAMAVRQAGWKVIYTPHAEGLHEEHSSMAITPKWRTVLEESNKKFAAKWGFYFKKNPNPNVIGKF